MLKRLMLLRFLVALGLLHMLPATAQDGYTGYGKKIYAMMLNNNRELLNEFVELQDYTAYIDELDKLPQHEKENIKYDASKSYPEVAKDFETECIRMLNLFQQSKQEGITFTYSTAEYQPSKSFPNIGFITFYYIVEIPGFEEPEEDGVRFECIKTTTGWRILDGFFDLTD